MSRTVPRLPSVKDLSQLLISLKPSILDNYFDPEEFETIPHMDVTIGWTPDDGTWNYQTGDNSFTGGAYGHPVWAVITLHRRDNCKAHAEYIRRELVENMPDPAPLPVVQYLLDSREQKEPTPPGEWEYAVCVPAVKTDDGCMLSVQAHATAYCSPKKNVASWTHVELKATGITEQERKTLKPYNEDGSGIYAFVPVAIVQRIIDAHGGIANNPATKGE